jgi:hypothetical protein
LLDFKLEVEVDDDNAEVFRFAAVELFSLFEDENRGTFGRDLVAVVEDDETTIVAGAFFIKEAARGVLVPITTVDADDVDRTGVATLTTDARFFLDADDCSDRFFVDADAERT